MIGRNFLVRMIVASLFFAALAITPPFVSAELMTCGELVARSQPDGSIQDPITGAFSDPPSHCIAKCPGTIYNSAVHQDTHPQIQTCPWNDGVNFLYEDHASRIWKYGYSSFCEYRVVNGVPYSWPAYYKNQIKKTNPVWCGTTPNPDLTETYDDDPPRPSSEYVSEPTEDTLSPPVVIYPTLEPSPTTGYFIPPIARRSAEYKIAVPGETVTLNGQCHLHGTGLMDIPAEYNNTSPMSLYLNALAYNDWDLYVWPEDRGWAEQSRYTYFAFNTHSLMVATNQQGSGTNSIIKLSEGLQGRMVCVVKSTATAGYTLGFYREE